MKQLPTFRKDVDYYKSDDLVEVGLVTHEEDAEPTHPTIFVSAYCKTQADRRWFDQVIQLLSRKR